MVKKKEPLVKVEPYKPDPDCKECGGRGTVYRYIGHEGRAAVFPCTCLA